MFTEVKIRINDFIHKGHQRSVSATKNVMASFLVKGLSILISLILVPLTIDYINTERYGIWLTMSSIILWFNFFDFGLGNGLRNRLAEAIANNDLTLMKNLISTSYVTLFFISSILCITFFIANQYIKWDQLLGYSIKYRTELHDLVGILMFLFCIQFVLQLINIINYAFQKAALVSAVYLMGSFFSLIFILILKHFIPNSLFWLGFSFFSGNLLSLALFSIYFFFIVRTDLKPSLKHVSFQNSKDILSLGSRFFVIQLAAIVQYQTVNVLISRYFTPNDVTEYNVSYKMFSVIMLTFGIIMAPIWSAVTEAKSKNDYSWIESTEGRLLKIWAIFAVLAVVLLLLSNQIYSIWLMNEVSVPFSVSLGIMLYVLSITYSSIYVNILNGLGKLKTQFYLSIITMILFIPISYYFAVYLHLGVPGISFALIVANVNGLIAAKIEFKYYIKKAKVITN